MNSGWICWFRCYFPANQDGCLIYFRHVYFLHWVTKQPIRLRSETVMNDTCCNKSSFDIRLTFSDCMCVRNAVERDSYSPYSKFILLFACDWCLQPSNCRQFYQYIRIECLSVYCQMKIEFCSSHAICTFHVRAFCVLTGDCTKMICHQKMFQRLFQSHIEIFIADKCIRMNALFLDLPSIFSTKSGK